MLDRLIARLRSRPPAVANDDRKQAAVALVLAPDPESVLLIRRADRAGDPWSGHLAFPGGRRDPDDTDLVATAIRETFEEVVIQLDREWCQVQLDDLLPRISLPPIVVRPFVFVVPTRIAAGVSAEVVASSWVPFSELLRQGVYRSRAVTTNHGTFDALGYDLGEGFLWGMTERILTPVLEVWAELIARDHR